MRGKRQRAAGILRAEQYQRKQSELPAGRRKHVGAAELREEAPPYHVAADVNPRTSSALSPARLRFIDLFYGIGGFRIAFERAGGQCVFSSDWNEQVQITYEANFGERPHGDIYSVPDNAIPPHHILCAGFPCQPFSIAGVSKKLSLGKKHGFEDKEQGNLFFKLADLIDHHQPDAFVLENVKHLQRHDQGRTFQIIHDTLTNALGYHVHHRVIDAQSVVPQHRERIFIVGFRERRHFEFPEFPAAGPKLESILDVEVQPRQGRNLCRKHAKENSKTPSGAASSAHGQHLHPNLHPSRVRR